MKAILILCLFVTAVIACDAPRETPAPRAARADSVVHDRKSAPPAVMSQMEFAEECRKAAEEIDRGGLVYLIKTLRANGDEYGTRTITGIVENRTGHRVGYAQISFNLFDRSGAQVGSAWATVTPLAAGDRWRFRAVTFEPTGTVVRFGALSGD